MRLTPNWSVGGGPVFGHSSVELIQAQDLSQQTLPTGAGTFALLGIAPETEFARVKVNGSANGLGFHLGVFGKLMPTLSVGARYLSTVKFKYDDADARFTQVSTGLTLPVGNPVNAATALPVDAVVASQFAPGGALVSQKASTEIRHPWQAAIGIGYTGIERTTLSADLVRFGWSEFNKLPLNFADTALSRSLIEDYDDSWSYRLGVEHMVKGYGLLNNVTVRAGFSYAQTPAPDETVTPLLPDMPRKNGSIGVGVPISMGTSTHLDASYLFVGTSGRRGRIVERTSTSQTAASLNDGAYDLKANVLSLTLTTSF